RSHLQKQNIGETSEHDVMGIEYVGIPRYVKIRNHGDNTHKSDENKVKRIESGDNNDYNIIININIDKKDGHEEEPNNGDEIYNPFLH
ncbi:unnamed protein product, partial [Schistosoma spindalis]